MPCWGKGGRDRCNDFGGSRRPPGGSNRVLGPSTPISGTWRVMQPPSLERGSSGGNWRQNSGTCNVCWTAMRGTEDEEVSSSSSSSGARISGTCSMVEAIAEALRCKYRLAGAGREPYQDSPAHHHLQHHTASSTSLRKEKSNYSPTSAKGS